MNYVLVPADKAANKVVVHLPTSHNLKSYYFIQLFINLLSDNENSYYISYTSHQENVV